MQEELNGGGEGTTTQSISGNTAPTSALCHRPDRWVPGGDMQLPVILGDDIAFCMPQIQVEKTFPLLLSHHGHFELLLIPDLSVPFWFQQFSLHTWSWAALLQGPPTSKIVLCPNSFPALQEQTHLRFGIPQPPPKAAEKSSTMFQLVLLILQDYWQGKAVKTGIGRNSHRWKLFPCSGMEMVQAFTVQTLHCWEKVEPLLSPLQCDFCLSLAKKTCCK